MDDADLSPCPFCPLHCDDVDVWGDDVASVCSLAAASVAAASRRVVRGEMPTLPTRPRVVVTGAGLIRTRRLVAMHSAGDIELLIERDVAARAMHRGIVRDGTITATLGEIRRRADAAWLIGDFDRHLPRITRYLHPDAALHRSGSVTVEDCLDPSGVLPNSFDAVRYAAVVIAPGAFGEDFTAASIAAELLLRWVRTRNFDDADRPRRAVLVPIGWANTVTATAWWTTNRSLHSGGGDIDVRLGSPGPAPTPVKIQIGGLDPGETLAAAYVPAAMAGVDCGDQVVRGDGTVTLRLRPGPDASPRTLPSATDVLADAVGRSRNRVAATVRTS